jgi:hypothetical protein
MIYKYNLACGSRHFGKLVRRPFRSFPTNFIFLVYPLRRDTGNRETANAVDCTFNKQPCSFPYILHIEVLKNYSSNKYTECIFINNCFIIHLFVLNRYRC